MLGVGDFFQQVVRLFTEKHLDEEDTKEWGYQYVGAIDTIVVEMSNCLVYSICHSASHH